MPRTTLRSWEATTVPPSVTSIRVPPIRAVKLPPGIPRRDRVEGLADADPGLAVDPDRDDPRRVEGLRGQRPERRPVGLAHRADGQRRGADVAGEVAPVGLLEPPVEVGEALAPSASGTKKRRRWRPTSPSMPPFSWAPFSPGSQ